MTAPARLPGPSIAAPLLVVGGVLLLSAPFAGPMIAGIAVLVLVLGAVRLATEVRREGRPYDRRTALAVRRVRQFARRHASSGGNAAVRIAVEHLGQDQHRLVLLAADGTYGDVVVDGEDRAEAVIGLVGAKEADATDREFAGRIRTTRYEWVGMTDSQLRRR